MTGFTAVLLYALWTLLLPLFYAGHRVPMIFGGRKRADHWERGKPVDDPPLLARAKNAHLNCTENFRSSLRSSASPRCSARVR